MVCQKFMNECSRWEAKRKWNVKLKARLMEVYCISRLVYIASFLETLESKKEKLERRYRKAIWSNKRSTVMKEEQAILKS